MSITLIKGRPGAGKSYECVVHQILPSLKDGRKIVTNMPLNIDRFALILGEEVRDLIEVYSFDFDSNHQYLSHPDDYKKYQEWRNDKGQGCLFVLDECHLLFPLQGRGKAQTDLASEQIKFFSGHRHYGFDFIFLTQSDRKINRLLREDIEICIEVRKNRAIGDNNYRRYVFYYGEGKKGGLIEQGSRKYEEKFFKLYSSHTKSKNSVSEASVKDLKKWHQNWGLRIGALILLIGPFQLIGNLTTIFSSSDKNELDPATNIASKPSMPQPSVPPPESKSKARKELVPFSKFDLYIDGYADFSYKDENGILHVDKQLDFTAVTKSKHELQLYIEDFYLAGYDVIVFGRCMVKLSYNDIQRFVYCRGKQPKQEENTSANISNLSPFSDS